ncbi:hypothetical protein FEM03_21225 [Phragmitibacter flavus]|uniref:Aerotolerance regulator N-terminal domain-containing protein n=2 Tax=Phragmitibacter flavus TaxID=2576071 RepID=A0A5R8K8R7_9BACT|nr:hypothetical protein FEM03_21225 [Phragmitibacter flavus]
MNVMLANSAGLWALLAVPVILWIHFLQERSRRVRVSTLFLLDRVAPESVGGARFEKLRNSLPLWLQILAALMLTWVLCEPRWMKEDSRQTVVVVLDSSVSMSAFKESTRRMLEEGLKDWAKGAVRTDWHVLETDGRKKTLYAGEDWRGVLSAFDEWRPMMGTHEVEEVLLVARGLVKEAGMVVLVTDHAMEVASDVAVVSAGEKMENVGFAGGDAKVGGGGGMRWQVLVKNYGERVATRAWWVEREGLPEGRRESVILQPGQTLVLSGELPPGERRMWLRLEGDGFVWDDAMPLQLPVERVLKVDFRLGNREGEVLRKMVESLPHVAVGNGDEAMTVAEVGTMVVGNAIQVVTGGGGGEGGGRLDGAFTVAEDHGLTRGLNWMGLLTNKPRELTLTAMDEPLLWKSDRVLAMVRTEVGADGRRWRRLILNWDLAGSNAMRHPAVLVMLHRFVEEVRQGLREPWSGNFEVGQVLKVEALGTGLTIKVGDEQMAFEGRVSEEVGFFEVGLGDEILVSGAAGFADAREADFSKSEALDTAKDRQWEAALKQTEADPWMPLWVLGILGCLLGSWYRKARAVD